MSTDFIWMDSKCINRSSAATGTGGQLASSSSKSKLSARKSSLKRSKSLHCPKSRFGDMKVGAVDRYPMIGGSQSNSQHQLQQQQKDRNVQYYASRRHHSTNDYMAEYEDETLGSNGSYPEYGASFGAMILKSSSHNLYYQFQNGSGSGPRGSCSSGTSIMSLNDGSNGRKDYYEDVFYDTTTIGASDSQSKLCAKLSSLNFSGNDSGKSNRARGSISNSSLYNNGDGLVEELTDTNDDDNVWDNDFGLDPFGYNTRLSKDWSDSSLANKGSQSSSNGGGSIKSNSTQQVERKHGAQYRFYIIKQKNYPPLYLENGVNRRRIYRVLVLGYPSSGKSTLIDQFSSTLANSERHRFNPASASQLDNKCNLLVHFLESDSFDKYLLQMPVTDYQPDVYLILYNINNRDSFNSVKKTLVDLQRWDDLETKAVIIVANKSDLVRGRCVTRRDGRELASSNNCKYIETSCTISHNVDVLLQGIGSQICLKEQQKLNQKEIDPTDPAVKIKRKPSFFKRILRRTAINKSKSCDNLHVL